MDSEQLNNRLIVINNEEDYKKVVQFCIDNQISFSTGLTVSEARELADNLEWESSQEQWINSSCW